MTGSAALFGDEALARAGPPPDLDADQDGPGRNQKHVLLDDVYDPISRARTGRDPAMYDGRTVGVRVSCRLGGDFQGLEEKKGAGSETSISWGAP